MTEWVDIIDYAFAIAGVTISIAGLCLSLIFRNLPHWTRQFFIWVHATLIVYVGSDLLSQTSLVLLGPEYSALSKATIFLESLASSALMPMLTFFLLYCCRENLKKNPLVTIVLILWAIYFGLLVFTQFTDVIYSVSETNVYQRGPLYALLLVPPILLMIVNFSALVIRRKRLTKRVRRAFLIFLLIPIVCMLIQMLVYGLLLIVIGTSISAFAMFLILLKEQAEEMKLQAEENARAQASIAVLEMRPHFIYNTMSTIYYLCALDPEKAQKVVGDFTTYLRKNLSAIAKDGLIPFEDELDHTRAYLAVEKARFEKLLFVTYDIPYTSFRIPPLTLQPLVENAVKHGLDPELDPLQIAVRTRHTGAETLVIVEDTGPGFDKEFETDPEPESVWGESPVKQGEDNSRIGLNNIHKRLTMYGNTLEIKPREGGGTVATIRITEE